ncbi:MAG: Ppx/GppA phosphatase family protein [Pseudomonadota bacterium]
MDNARSVNKSGSSRKKNRAPLYAAVDLGTNNCRLLIARRRASTFRVIDSYAQIVRLGEGLAASGRLSEAAILRAIDALTAIRRKLKHHGVGHVRCIATEACRKAENGATFIRRVQDETRLSFKIINPKEEAHLAAIGCHDLLDAETDLFMVLDIGGGSTEISFVDLSKQQDRSVQRLVKSAPIRAWASFPLGVVTLSESFAHLGEADAYPRMVAHARDHFEKWSDGTCYRDTIQTTSSHIIGTSGTVTCLAGVHLGLEKYRRDRVDGLWLERDETDAVINTLKVSGLAGREALPTIGKERAGLMLSGCAILEAAWDTWPAPQLRVADRGLREGLLLSMMHGGKRRSGSRRGRRRRSRVQAMKSAVQAEAVE